MGVFTFAKPDGIKMSFPTDPVAVSALFSGIALVLSMVLGKLLDVLLTRFRPAVDNRKAAAEALKLEAEAQKTRAESEHQAAENYSQLLTAMQMMQAKMAEKDKTDTANRIEIISLKAQLESALARISEQERRLADQEVETNTLRTIIKIYHSHILSLNDTLQSKGIPFPPIPPIPIDIEVVKKNRILLNDEDNFSSEAA